MIGQYALMATIDKLLMKLKNLKSIGKFLVNRLNSSQPTRERFIN